MNALEIVTVTVLPALFTFYLTSRVYLRKLKAKELRGWDEPGIFVYALLMSAIWPLSLLWVLAQPRAKRPTKEERERARERERIVQRQMQQMVTAQKERELGIGEFK